MTHFLLSVPSAAGLDLKLGKHQSCGLKLVVVEEGLWSPNKTPGNRLLEVVNIHSVLNVTYLQRKVFKILRDRSRVVDSAGWDTVPYYLAVSWTLDLAWINKKLDSVDCIYFVAAS